MSLSRPSAELAHKVISRIQPRGDIIGLNVPVDLLDPEGLRLWVELELGDTELARSIALAEKNPVTLLADRRRQSDEVLAATAN